MARRRADIEKGDDVSCDVCIKQRRAGHPRPSCEECGREKLSADNLLIWEIYCTYFALLTISNGFGGVTINLDGVQMVCADMQIADTLEFASRISTILVEFGQQKDQQDDDE